MTSSARRFLLVLVGFLGVLCLFNAAPAQAQSSDNTLRALTVEVSTNGTNFSQVGLHPEFSAGQRSYDTVVSTSHTHVRVTPTVNHTSATVKVGKQGTMLSTVNSGSASAAIALVDGANPIRIQVTAQDRDTESYYVTVTQGGRVVPAPPRYVQATAGAAKLTLTWERPIYWGSFPAGGYEVDWYAGASPPMNPSDWNRATPTVSPLAANAISYEFTGTYGDHTVVNGTTYQLRVRAFNTNPNDDGDHLPSEWVIVAGTPPNGSSQSSDARLSNLTASSSTSSGGTFSPLNIGTFAATTTSYTATVANSITHVKLTPTVNHASATVKVGKQGTTLSTVNSGSASGEIALSMGANAITVRVTAQDSTTKDYTVTITRQTQQTQSSDANLSNLTASSSTSSGGTFSPLNIGTFAATTTSYTATVANSITHVKLTPTVNHASATVKVGKQGTTLSTVNSGSASGEIALSMGANAITVRVTAQDSTTKDYTVTITRQTQQTQSSDANLSNLTASSSTSSGGTFSPLNIGTFAATTTSYTATVANSITHVKLTPTVNHASATVKVGKQGTTLSTVNSGSASGEIALSVGANAITVRVTAQDSTTKDYTVTITRQTQQTQSSDANLSNLTASSSTSSGGTFSPLNIGTFAATTTSYTATVANSITHVKLTPTVNHASATVKVGKQGTTLSTVNSGSASGEIALSVGANAITVRVTAQDSTTKDYTVTITRQTQQTQSSDANLSNLTASSSTSSGGTFSPLNIGTFAATTTSYTATVANSITHVKLTPTVNHASATVKVGKQGTTLSTVNSGSASGEIALSVGANAITVRVTAQDSTTKDYTVLITANPPPLPRDTGGTPSPALSGDASLNTLGIEGISPDFDPDTYTYTLNAYSISSLTLTPTANHENAEITVNGETIESGSSATVPLDDDGETTITIVVTAEDGTTTRTYEITVTHCGEEREDLVRFYEKTGGEDWSDNENWNSEEPLGQWFGVETNEDDEVISLRLPDNGLSGETPRELLCLSELVELALWDNDSLSGEVPEELVLAVERAALRDVAVALSLNTEWFESYENPYDFSGWDSGVETDDDGRVTELDFSDTEEIEGTIPAVLLEQLRRLGTLYVNCTVSVEGDTPAEVNVEEVCEEPEPPKEPEEPSGGGGCALSSGSGDSPVFGLFLMTLLVFAVLGRKRARG